MTPIITPMMTAAELDAADELAGFAAEFAKPPGIYLDGNSLGLLGRTAETHLNDAIAAWRNLAIRGWTEGENPWFAMSRRASAKLAPLLGCEPDDVMIGGSATANLHQILATFCDARDSILLDGTHFPSDRYAVDSFLRTRGESQLGTVQPDANRLLDENAIIMQLRQVGFAVLPAVVYTTGQLLDLPRVTHAATGKLIAWDCSHSVGVVPHRFRDDAIDIAFGCSYKYLNGGPGAPGWLYVHPRLRNQLPGLAGWFGCDPARQFEMGAAFCPAADANRYQVGTPHILSLAPLVGSLSLLNDAGIDRIRAKSIAQTEYFIQLAIERLARHSVGIISPKDNARRGGHVTLSHPEAAKLSRALRLRGVVPDFRPPDMLRLAPAPLYNSFADCEMAMTILDEILTSRAHLELADADDVVT